ncbi:MAG: pentapeptide repeat-containing protein, partial [Candidatus Lokiarchaeota archaeon]|nr:pentapeptide repeat-containing protein [Candidatus Lokiarchaeota archaeon]
MSDNKIDQKLMWEIAEGSPLAQEQLDAIARKHHAFLASGGGGGTWETLLASGMVFAIYRGPAGNEAELRYKKVEGLSLRGLSLPYSEWIGSLCRGQDLDGADLTGSVLTDADFTGTSFHGARLARADFSRSRLVNCDLRGADLSGADLEGADLRGADL